MKKKFNIFYYEKDDFFVVGEPYTTNWLLFHLFEDEKYPRTIEVFSCKQDLYSFLLTNPRMDGYDFSKLKIINIK